MRRKPCSTRPSMADGARSAPALRVAAPEQRRAEAPARPRAKAPRRPRLRTILLALGPLVLIIASLWLYLGGGRYIATDNAYVQADQIAIATDVSGLVKEVAVKDNQLVARGQLLFRLDD